MKTFLPVSGAAGVARLAPMALAVGLLVPSAALAQEGAPGVAPPSEAALPAITVSEVIPEMLRDWIVASGLVAAVEQVQVQPLIEGQAIDSLRADVGDQVEAGQVLATLSGAMLDLQRSELLASRAQVAATVAQAEANLIEANAAAEEAERVAARSARLAQQGTVSQAQADEADAAAKAARARARAAEQGIMSARAQRDLVEAQISTLDLQLERTQVRTSVAGLVVARNAEVGAIASTTGPAMFTIIRDGAMEMRAELSEADLLRVRHGQAVRLAAIGGADPLSGTVRLVDPSIDLDTRLGRARITIDDPANVLEGMFLTAEILVSAKKSLAAPVTAVSTGAGGASVMLVREGTVERVPVTTGIRDGGLIGVTEGVDVGDIVVTKAASFVRDGDMIDPIPDQTRHSVADEPGEQS